jgi:hypothetical protein
MLIRHKRDKEIQVMVVGLVQQTSFQGSKIPEPASTGTNFYLTNPSYTQGVTINFGYYCQRPS